jgi:hypothetical protein
MLDFSILIEIKFCQTMANSSNANTVEGEGVTVVNKQAGVPRLREVIQNLKRQNKQVKIIFMFSVMNILYY